MQTGQTQVLTALRLEIWDKLLIVGHLGCGDTGRNVNTPHTHRSGDTLVTNLCKRVKQERDKDGLSQPFIPSRTLLLLFRLPAREIKTLDILTQLKFNVPNCCLNFLNHSPEEWAYLLRSRSPAADWDLERVLKVKGRKTLTASHPT